MKRSALFLQIAVVLAGTAALAFLLIEPHFEGRNVHATVFEIYFKDPFLAYAYIASVPFFTALFQIFNLLGLFRKDEIFSQLSVSKLQIIQKCGWMMIVFVAGGVLWILLSNSEEKPPGIMMGLIISFISLTIISSGAVLEKILQDGLELKSAKN